MQETKDYIMKSASGMQLLVIGLLFSLAMWTVAFMLLSYGAQGVCEQNWSVDTCQEWIR